LHNFFDFPIYFQQIDPDVVYDTLKASDGEKTMYAKTYLNHPLIERIDYMAYLPVFNNSNSNFNNSNSSEWNSEISISFRIKAENYEQVEKYQKRIEKIFENQFARRKGYDEFYEKYPEMNVIIATSTLWEEGLDNGNYEYFNIELSTYLEKIPKIWTIYDYVRYSNTYLTAVAQKIAILLEDEKLLKKEEKPVPVFVDFNDILMDSKEYMETLWDPMVLWWKINKWSTKIIEKVTANDIAPKLFLDETTEIQLEQLISYLKNKEEKDKLLLKPIKWAMFLWKPGLGKTESVKYIEQQTSLPVYTLSIEKIEYYKVLEKWPAILYIDEADGLLSARKEGDNDFMNSVKNIILQEMDGFSTNPNLKKWFIIVSTNFGDALDKAIKDRFSFFIEYKMPDEEKRYEYFIFIKDFIKDEKGISFDENIDFEKIAQKTNNFSYRALSNLINNAILHMNWKTLTQKDFDFALTITKANEQLWNVIWFRKN